jgi:hypothetical protein
MVLPYPRDSVGWIVQRIVQQWGIPQDRICTYLQITPAVLAALSLAPLPHPDRQGFDAQLDKLAGRYGVSAWRLGFLCRQASRSPVRLRD